MEKEAPKGRYKKRGPYKKRERKIYRIGLDVKEHGELIRILDLVPRAMRGEYIAESIMIARRRCGLTGAGGGLSPPETPDGIDPIELTFDK